MDKVDPSGMAVTYFAAEKGFKRAELSISDLGLKATPGGLAGW